jgi:uroporphyrinogen III methyltransferase/synthase
MNGVKQKSTGKVYLVGAGPGDPGLLTLKGLEVLRMVDVVLYDRLVSSEIIKLIPKKTTKIYVGKEGDNVSKLQSRINRIMVEEVKTGKSVARLKGGDPFVFGRGGEEVQYLRKRGIIFEVVPGITSAFAAPAYAGIPVSHRNYASSIGIVTGTEEKDARSVNWRKIGSSVDTIVILMGMSNLAEIIKQISISDKGHRTNVAIIEWGTTRRQRVVFGTLGNIVERSKKLNVKAPVVIVIGKVVSLGKELSWFETERL